jgi:hypothetical protein
LRLALRRAYLLAAVILLLVIPWGYASLVLVLFVAADFGVAALMLRADPAPADAAVVVLDGDRAKLNLLRRTVPKLRMRRSAVAIDAQIRWRQAAEAHRRRHHIAS